MKLKIQLSLKKNKETIFFPFNKGFFYNYHTLKKFIMLSFEQIYHIIYTESHMTHIFTGVLNNMYIHDSLANYQNSVCVTIAFKILSLLLSFCKFHNFFLSLKPVPKKITCIFNNCGYFVYLL